MNVKFLFHNCKTEILKKTGVVHTELRHLKNSLDLNNIVVSIKFKIEYYFL